MNPLPLHDRAFVQTEHLNLSLLAGLHFPHEVLTCDELDANQKPALLSSWASDAAAVPSFPTLRHLPGTPFPVTFSSVMEARKRLDAIGSEAVLYRRRGRGGDADAR